MAYLASHFINSPVYIYDENNNLITCTTVTGYSSDEMYIEVPKGATNIKLRTRLHILIIHSAGASEFSGSLRSVRQGLYEISIYGEQQREGRTADRRTLNTSAMISDMVTDSGANELQTPIPTMLENISATGVLVKIENIRINIGTFLQIEFNIIGKEVVLYGEVVRECMLDDHTFEYGCQLHFLN